MGLLDSSMIPTPGGQDLLVVILAGTHADAWLYYATLGVAGSVLGGCVSYAVGRRGGMPALQRRVSEATLDRMYRVYDRWGFGAVFFPAILPPPVPIGPFLVAAGALNYSLRRFVAALTLAKAIRLFVLAYLASIYGRRVLATVVAHYWIVLVVVAVVGAAAAVFARRARLATS